MPRGLTPLATTHPKSGLLTGITGTSYPARGAHLAAAWALSVSQPVFSLLDAYPEFLAVRRSTLPEVLAFALLLAFGPPLLALGVEWIVSRASPAAGAALHAVFLAIFLVPLGLEIVKSWGLDGVVVVALALLMALVVVVNYARWKPIRLFLSYLVVLPLVGVVSFVLGAPTAKENVPGVEVSIDSRTPIVMLVLDELPVSSLMEANGTIDAIRYPNFARLAAMSTWYSNTTSVHEHSTGAVPAILTGSMPGEGALPTLADQPRNLFTLLGETYAMDVHETSTLLCPARYCPEKRDQMLERVRALFADVRVLYLHRILPEAYTRRLPEIGDRWGSFSQREELLLARDAGDVDRVLVKPPEAEQGGLGSFLEGLSKRPTAPTLHFLHLVLPHSPWRYLPSGRQYGNAATIDGIVDSWNQWDDNAWLVEQGYQRHLLQVGYADRRLGELLDALGRSGLLDRALVVVLADHGVSFRAGGTRRTVNDENIGDISRVPLFVKYPGQRTGRVDRRPVQTIDVLPTIADVLGARVPWPVDGTSLLAAGDRSHDVVVSRRDGTLVRASVSEVDDDMTATLRHKTSLFGTGSQSLYRIGTNTELLGRHLADLQLGTSSTARVRFDGEGLLASVRTAGPFIPARITGTVVGFPISPAQELAVAVNGRIVALTRTFVLDGRQRFGAVVPETAFRDGANQVALLAIGGAGPTRRLVVLGETGGAQQYALSSDGRFIVLPGGQRALIEHGRIAGRLETWRLESGTARFRGWAADVPEVSLPDSIVVFAAGRLVYAGETTEYRWDVPETQGVAGLERSGWVVELPARAVTTGLRVFAVRDTVASELPLPVDLPWD